MLDHEAKSRRVIAALLGKPHQERPRALDSLTDAMPERSGYIDVDRQPVRKAIEPQRRGLLALVAWFVSKATKLKQGK